VPARLRPAPAADVTEALAASPRSDEQTRLLVKHFLAVLGAQAPGRSVEVRVPPYAAVQAIPGVRHTRGTPPAVVETDASTWVGLATGSLSWDEAERSGLLRASGERADLSPYLPLTNPEDLRS
jgi:Bacterial SCP ortholog